MRLALGPCGGRTAKAACRLAVAGVALGASIFASPALAVPSAGPSLQEK